MIHMKREKTGMGQWLHQLEKRSHPHVALVAMANKIARIASTVFAMGAAVVLLESGGVHGAGVLTSRSTNGGTTWGNPVLVGNSNLGNPDKNWIVCDNTSTSPYYGNCYTQWDDNGDGNRLYMSTSTDGGLTWSNRAKTANNATGIGGQPVVQPNGTVIVPVDTANEGSLQSFTSTDGGATWSTTTLITTISHHTVAGGLRTGPLPSAEIDGAGNFSRFGFHLAILILGLGGIAQRGIVECEHPRARRNKLLGLWAAEKLGKSGETFVGFRIVHALPRP